MGYFILLYLLLSEMWKINRFARFYCTRNAPFAPCVNDKGERILYPTYKPTSFSQRVVLTLGSGLMAFKHPERAGKWYTAGHVVIAVNLSFQTRHGCCIWRDHWLLCTPEHEGPNVTRSHWKENTQVNTSIITMFWYNYILEKSLASLHTQQTWIS